MSVHRVVETSCSDARDLKSPLRDPVYTRLPLEIDVKKVPDSPN